MAENIFTYNGRIPTYGGGNRIPYFITPDTDADAAAFISAAGITDPTQQSAIETLVTDLKTNSLWTKMYAIYPFVGGTSTTHKYNLKDPRDLDAAFRLAFSGTVTHNSNGITPNGTNGYANTYLTPSTTMVNNDTHISYYCRTNSAAARIEIGVSMATSRMVMHTKWSDNNLYSDCYEFTNGRVAIANSDSTGFYIQTRVSSTDHRVFRNGSQLGSTNTTTTTGTTADITNPIFIGARNTHTSGAADYSNRNLAFASFGTSLTTGESSTLNTIISTFQTTLGRNV
jgi:hypothetical protein